MESNIYAENKAKNYVIIMQFDLWIYKIVLKLVNKPKRIFVHLH